jgi:hypothetical protein
MGFLNRSFNSLIAHIRASKVNIMVSTGLKIDHLIFKNIQQLRKQRRQPCRRLRWQLMWLTLFRNNRLILILISAW